LSERDGDSFDQNFDNFYNAAGRKPGTYVYSGSRWSLAVPDFVTDEGDFRTDGYGTITGYTGNDTLIVIPASIGGVPTLSIGARAFSDKKITMIIIPDGVTTIRKNAFSFNKLTSVTIPDSVESIDEFAFDSNLLTGIDIGKNVRTISEGAFPRNKLSSVTIADGVSRIERHAFFLNQLRSIILPSSVTFIGFEAFDGNPLSSITLGANLTMRSAFSESFCDFYDANGKQAGTYEYRDDAWCMR
jgi:hypothetical protein